MDIKAFLTAYDPSDLPGGSIDPLGFERGYLFLADKILPGMTNVAQCPRYFGVLCAGARLAAIDGEASPRRLYEARRATILRLERLWVLANVLAAKQNPEIALSGLRGVMYAQRHEAQLAEGEASHTGSDYRLLSRQTPYGAIGMYGSVAEGLHLLRRDVLELTPDLGERLLARAKRFRSALQDLGFDTGRSTSQIIPLMLGDNQCALAFSRALKDKGILAVAVRPPTVPAGTARLRLSVTLAHTDADLEQAAGLLAETARTLGVI